MYYICFCLLLTERISDDEEEGPTAAVTPPTQRRPHPPSSLPTRVASSAPPVTSQTSAGGSRAPKLSVESPEDRSGAASPRRNKFASAVSNSFDLSGDEGGTPAVFGNQYVICLCTCGSRAGDRMVT